MANIEIVGIPHVQRAFSSLNSEMRPMVLREIARKPANRAALEARRMQPIGDSGETERTIGLLKVRNGRQPFVEVGYRGRSLGHIYTSGTVIYRSKRGSVKGFPNLFHNAGDAMRGTIVREMKVDLTRVAVRAMKKYGIG